MKKIVTITTAALALVGGAGMASLASGSSSSPGGSVVSASPTGVAHAAAAAQGWQGDFVYTVPAGTSGLFFHYPCPGTLTPDAGK